MSISSQKVAKATITYNDSNNESAIVIKDKDVFPNGFKYVFRPDSKHANLIREHFVEEIEDGLDWERIANNAYLDARRDPISSSGTIFLGVDMTPAKTPVKLEAGQLTTAVIVLQEFLSGAVMEIFIKRQFLESARHHQVLNVNMFNKTSKKLSRTGAQDLDYDKMDMFLRTTDTPVLVAITHRQEYQNFMRHNNQNPMNSQDGYDAFAYQSGIKNKLQGLLDEHHSNKLLTFLTPYQPFGLPTVNIASIENHDLRYRFGNDTGFSNTIHLPSDFITVPDRSSISRLL